MKVQIFDVGHGLCALLVGASGIRILFDAGHSDAFRPSQYLPSQGHTAVDQLVITNFDHDHVSDLPELSSTINIRSISRNPSIPAAVLRNLKLANGPLTTALTTALDMHETWTGPALSLNYGTLSVRQYWNNYPTFTDTNNLSLVTFIEEHGTRLVIPGDIEVAGWKALLQRADFRQDLAGTHIVVASHHGRDSGYCEDVFTHCNPHLCIISDDVMQYDTQDHCYGKHCSGLRWSDGSTRRVLTTRNDGHITITNTSPQLGYQVQVRKGVPPM